MSTNLEGKNGREATKWKWNKYEVDLGGTENTNKKSRN